MNYSKAHEELVEKIHLEIGSMSSVRLFKRPVGFAKTENGNAISFGVPGEPDLQGFIKNKNGPAYYLAIEVKTGKATLSKKQKKWRDMALKFGVIHITARSLKQVLTEIEKYL